MNSCSENLLLFRDSMVRISIRRQETLASSPRWNPNRTSSRFRCMTHFNSTSPRNTMTIAAMLMLSSAMVQAQEVVLPTTPAPVLSSTVDPAAPAPAPAPIPMPTIVLPEPRAVSAPAGVAPVVPAPAAEVRTATVAAPRSASSRATPATQTAITQTARPTPVAAAAQPAPAPPVVETATEPVEAAPAFAPPESVTSSSTDTAPDWALPVGLGASILVLGGVAMALRRRRRPYEDDVDFVPPVVVSPARPAMQRTVAAPRPTVAYTPTVAAMPPVAPSSASEREALLDRMVAASPDAANPFTSRKARRRRARLILQSMPAQSTPAQASVASSMRVAPRVPIAAPAERSLVDA